MKKPIILLGVGGAISGVAIIWFLLVPAFRYIGEAKLAEKEQCEPFLLLLQKGKYEEIYDKFWKEDYDNKERVLADLRLVEDTLGHLEHFSKKVTTYQSTPKITFTAKCEHRTKKVSIGFWFDREHSKTEKDGKLFLEQVSFLDPDGGANDVLNVFFVQSAQSG